MRNLTQTYQEKDSVFECGFHSFLGQNRTQFSVSFFIFGLLFLLFDLEILLVYPYSVSGYNNDIYGLAIMIIFFVLLTLGFVFELGKNALTIDSKQTLVYSNNKEEGSDIYLQSRPFFFTPWVTIPHIFLVNGTSSASPEELENKDKGSQKESNGASSASPEEVENREEELQRESQELEENLRERELENEQHTREINNNDPNAENTRRDPEGWDELIQEGMRRIDELLIWLGN